MPTYKVTDPTTGKTVRLTGDSPPTENELEQVFSSLSKPPASTGEKIYRKANIFAGGANVGLANVLGTPVDILNLGFSAMGLGTPEPVAGSEWIKRNIMPASVKPEGLAENIVATTGEQIPYVMSSFIPGLGPLSAETAALRNQIIQGAKFAGGAGVGGGIARTIAPENEWAKLGGEMVGALTPMGGRIALEKLAKTSLPERLYGSAVKTPLSKKWIQTLGPEQISQRKMVLEEGVKERVPPSEYGISKANQLERETKNAVDTVINEATARGDATIKTADILDAGLNRAYKVAANSSDPIGAKDIVDAYKNTFLEGHGEELTIAKANAIKRQLYNETKWTGNAPTGLSAQLSEVMKKGTAHKIMTELEMRYPVLDSLNQTDAARIGLKEAIERSVARHGNTDLLGLGAKVLSGRDIPMMIWEATVGHPQIKARLAFALDKARSAARSMTNPNIPPILPVQLEPRMPEDFPPGLPIGPAERRLLAAPEPGSFTMRPSPRIGLPSGPAERLLLPAPGPEDFTMRPTPDPRMGERSVLTILESGLSGPEILGQAGTQADRIKQALSKPAFMRTAEDRMALLEASRSGETMRLTPEIVSQGAFTPKPPAEAPTPKAGLPSAKETPPPKPLPVETKTSLAEQVYHAKTKGDFKGGELSTEIGSDADIMGKGFYFGSKNYVSKYGTPEPYSITGNFATNDQWVSTLKKYSDKPIQEQRRLSREELQSRGYVGVKTPDVGIVWDKEAIKAIAEPGKALMGQSQVIQAQRRGDQLQISFDPSLGPVPSVKSLESILSSPEYRAIVTPLTGMVSKSTQRATFRIDVFDKEDRLSESAAKKIMEDHFGGKEFYTPTQRQKDIKKFIEEVPKPPIAEPGKPGIIEPMTRKTGAGEIPTKETPMPEGGKYVPPKHLKPLVEEIRSVGAEINPDGTITLYHATTKEKATRILKDGYLRRPADAPDSYGVYASTSRTVAEDYGDGTLIKIRVPIKDIHPDDVFPGKRLDFSIPTQKGNYRPIEVLTDEGFNLSPPPGGGGVVSPALEASKPPIAEPGKAPFVREEVKPILPKIKSGDYTADDISILTGTGKKGLVSTSHAENILRQLGLRSTDARKVLAGVPEKSSTASGTNLFDTREVIEKARKKGFIPL